MADRLEAAIPGQPELSLVHGDYHLLNVIASPSGDELRAVLDWELCTLGDPLADLGSLLAYWPEAGDIGAGPFPIPLLPGFPSRADLAQVVRRRRRGEIYRLFRSGTPSDCGRSPSSAREFAPARSTPATRSATGMLATDYLQGLVAQAELVASEAGF